MIIKMSRPANRLTVEYVAGILQRKGFTVYIKNRNEEFIVAVFGEGVESINWTCDHNMVGVEVVRDGEKIFQGNRQEFIPAEEYFLK